MGNEVIWNLILLTRRWNTDVYSNTVQVQAEMIVRYCITLLDFFGLRIIVRPEVEDQRKLENDWERGWARVDNWTLKIETRDLFVCSFLKVIGGEFFLWLHFPCFFFLKMSSKSPLQVQDWCNNNWFSTLLATEPPVNQWLENPWLTGVRFLLPPNRFFRWC